MSPQNILVFGANGQVGAQIAAQYGLPVKPLTRAEADFSRPELLASLVDELKPAAVFNGVAYTQVDKAESEPELAEKINAIAPKVLAGVCLDLNIPLIHFSTDYVYPGTGTDPWTENSPAVPLNVYAQTKLRGDQAVIESGCNHLIFRTTWVYDSRGKNFLATMLKLGTEREELKVVNDQVGSPSYAKDLAQAAIAAYRKALTRPLFPSGVYHLHNEGFCSWHDFACAIFSEARKLGLDSLKVKRVLPIPSSDYPTPAKRPFNSRLSSDKLKSTFGISLPPWDASMKECLKEILSK